jgi:hypothetical protein
MSEHLLKATHTGVLRIGDSEIAAFVLENGERVLSTRGVMKSLGRTWRGRKYPGTELPVFLEAANLKPFISEEVEAVLKPIKFLLPPRLLRGEGYKAEALPTVCDIYLQARDAKVLRGKQELVAKKCEMLVRSLSKVGIIALVDEVTGYQAIRDKRALQEILDKYLLKEFAAWAKRFPDEFYKQMFRLRGWQWRGMKVNRPSVVGKYTNDLIYQRLAPGVLEELQKRNPKDDKGNREGKHHQLLTPDLGIPALQNHLFATTKFMEASATWDQFYRSMQRAFPKLNSNLVLNFPEPEDQPT